MEQGLYSQVLMIRRKYLDNKNKRIRPINITSEGSLQDQNASLILIMSGQKKISTYEPELYKKLYQINIKVQEIKTYQFSIVPIGNAKITE